LSRRKGENGSRYQAIFIRSRGFRVLQRPFVGNCRKRVGLLPPLASLELSLGTLGSSNFRRRRGCAPQTSASPALRCHLSVLPFLGPHRYRRASSTKPAFPMRLAEAPRPYSICKIERPFFSPLAKRRKNMPGPSEVPSSGFGYPLDDVSPLDPRGSLSTLNALGVPPSELFSSPAVESRFPQILPRLHFRKKPTSLSRVLPWFPPTGKAESLLRSPKD
jgi:hypothetical protein